MRYGCRPAREGFRSCLEFSWFMEG
jgi:hypothetical protein